MPRFCRTRPRWQKLSGRLPVAEEFRLDKRELRRAFERAAAEYDAHAALQREICDRLTQRLDYLKLAPVRILDAGCGTGYASRSLLRHFPKAELLTMDLAPAMLRLARGQTSWWERPWQSLRKPASSYVCGDLERLPLKASTVDFVWSSLAFQWVGDLAATLRELYRIQKPGGAILFSTFGPDTLKELRAVFTLVDERPHVSRFTDMHDIGDMLVHAGYQNPVMEMEHITLTYDNLKALMQDIKRIGAHNASADRPRGMLGRGAWQRLEQGYERYRREGRLPATYEVVYGHAWVGDKTQRTDGQQIVHLDIQRRRSARGLR
ncbi:MAG TPA: malonyl-ACP O-methyltransferase BioC [Thiobacillaceae bacterium]|nr:malonyl-ACP O-methyltransferase BioC [Thiobacillaceae bacterium]